MWGATDLDMLSKLKQDISIHAPHVGSDLVKSPSDQNLPDISIHAPHVGSDVQGSGIISRVTPFQSTLPMWGATFNQLKRDDPYIFISIHAPHVGSDVDNIGTV